MNREILVSMLEGEYDLIQAEDGQQAVYIMSEHHMELSLLLLDMNMPVMNGYEVLQVMKRKTMAGSYTGYQYLGRFPLMIISGRAYKAWCKRLFLASILMRLLF